MSCHKNIFIGQYVHENGEIGGKWSGKGGKYFTDDIAVGTNNNSSKLCPNSRHKLCRNTHGEDRIGL